MPHLDNALAHAAVTPPHSRASLYGVLVLGLLATAVATFAVHAVTSAQEERQFERMTSDFIEATELRIERYVNATLQTRAFLTVLPEPTRAQFSRYVNETEFLQRYPGITGIGFAARVSPEQLDGFVAATRQDGVPDFTVRPAGERDEYFPIQLLEPADFGNMQALGYDMFSEPTRREAMERARDTGQPIASGLVTLVQNHPGAEGPGFLIYVAVYQGTPTTMEERRRALLGFAYAPIRTGDFFEALLAETKVRREFGLEVYGDSQPGQRNLIFAIDMPEGLESGQKLFVRERLRGLGERTWTFAFARPQSGFARREAAPLFTALLGLVITLLLFKIVVGHWRRAENERHGKERERAFRSFIETVLDTTRALLIVYDSDSQVIFFNQHAEEVTGFSRDEIRGRKSPLVFIPEGEKASAKRTAELLVEGRGGEWHEGEIVTKEGERRIIAWSNAVTRDEAGEVLFVIAAGIDVTQIRASEAERARLLAQSQRDVESLRVERELREKFVATLTHDLRNPLGAARLSAESLRRRDPDSTRLARVVSNIDRADRMIQDLLDAVRARAGKAPPLRIKSFDLVALVRETLDDLAMMLGPRFELHAPDTLSGHWSATGLRRLVENLATNAVKYGDPDAAVVVTLASSGDRVSLSVHNEGNPIPPEEQAQLFKDFVRSPSAEASDRQGWGLGLTVIKEVTAAHKGSVRVTSAPGHGTTFTVALPLDARAGSDEELEEEETSRGASGEPAVGSHPRLD